MYCIITTCSVECCWHCSDGTVHYKSDKTVNLCGFRCATTSPITVFINFVFYIYFVYALMYANSRNFALKKSKSRNTMMTSDFRAEVEIWPFCACTMKNVKYNPYLWPNCRNFRVLMEIVVEHYGDVRFKSPSGNMAVMCM